MSDNKLHEPKEFWIKNGFAYESDKTQGYDFHVIENWAYAARQAEIDELRAALERIQACVNEQAKNEGLWSVPFEGLQSIAEAYLQMELRNLHAVIELAIAHAALAGGGSDE